MALTLSPLANALRAELPPLIPREVLFGNPEKAGTEIAPDGKLLAYRAPHKGVLNVWVRTIGQNDGRVVTADKKRGIRWFIFEYDSEHILYIQDLDGDENWHIYQTNLKTIERRPNIPGGRCSVAYKRKSLSLNLENTLTKLLKDGGARNDLCDGK